MLCACSVLAAAAALLLEVPRLRSDDLDHVVDLIPLEGDALLGLQRLNQNWMQTRRL
jgi:hypothetical protein